MTDKPGWDVESEVIMQNRHNTAGLIATDAMQKTHTSNAQAARFSVEYLQQALEAAEALSDDDVWLTVEEDLPLVITPTDRADVSVTVAPRIGPGNDGENPTEGL